METEKTEDKKPKKPKKLPYVFLILAFYLLFTGIFTAFAMLVTKGYIPSKHMQTFLFLFAILIIVGNILYSRFVRAGYAPVPSDDTRYSFYANKREGTAFLAYYNHQGSGTDIFIPDEIDGCRVIALGGRDRGKKEHLFHIKISPQSLGCDKLVDEAEYIKKHRQDDRYETLTFNVKVGKNLYRFANVGPQCKNAYLVKEARDEKGKKQYDFAYKIAFNFTVDEANERIYSKNGRLYAKEKNIPIMVFNYE